MAYPDRDIPFTRITEHKHFAPWEKHDRTIVSYEYSRDCEPGDIPYYPIRLANEQKLLKAYVARAEEERGVSFVGRLGTYRYLDMDVTIGEALLAAETYLQCKATQAEVPRFFAKVLD